MSAGLTYKKAGVDIEAADIAKEEMAKYVSIGDSRILNRIGAFASLFEAKFPGTEHPVLVLKAEEPGSKQILAVKHNRTKSIGYDLVNHLINDIIVVGATPLAVLDTIFCGKLEKHVILELVKSVAQACREQGCTLVGGETSEQPGALAEGVYLLCASAVGVVEKSRIIDGSHIRAGDYLLGLASSGPHTNGYSLIRKIISYNNDIINSKVEDETFLDAILRPHKCYYQCLKGLFAMPKLHGLAHITGGGIEANLGRILPEGFSARIDLDKIHVLPVFKKIREIGDVSDYEMMRTFNMGVGMVLVAHFSAIKNIQKHLAAKGSNSYVIGEIVRGDQTVEINGKLDW